MGHAGRKRGLKSVQNDSRSCAGDVGKYAKVKTNGDLTLMSASTQLWSSGTGGTNGHSQFAPVDTRGGTRSGPVKHYYDLGQMFKRPHRLE